MAHAHGGKFTGTRTQRPCQQSDECPVCGMCRNYSLRSAKCKECYQWPTHCMCAQHGHIDRLADTISQVLDTPMWDKNNPSGRVEVHGDPAQDLVNQLNAKVEAGELN